MVAVSKEYLRRIRNVLKARRIALGFKQSEVAERAGIKLRSLQHFEQSGGISLEKLLKLLVLYRMDSRILACFEDRSGWSLEELERAETRKKVR
ncbi:MAG: helix-turn-helix domain-containing protein [Fibrobacterota bacterium]